MQLNTVVLPAPLGPIRPKISPFLTSKVRSSTAFNPPKYILRFFTLKTTSSATPCLSFSSVLKDAIFAVSFSAFAVRVALSLFFASSSFVASAVHDSSYCFSRVAFSATYAVSSAVELFSKNFSFSAESFSSKAFLFSRSTASFAVCFAKISVVSSPFAVALKSALAVL